MTIRIMPSAPALYHTACHRSRAEVASVRGLPRGRYPPCFPKYGVPRHSELMQYESSSKSMLGSLSSRGFTLVGLPDAAVREAYPRVRSALRHCGYWLPQRHITVNLSPADVKKEGSAFDLPIAIGILARRRVSAAEKHVAGRVFVGELSLDGALAPVRGTLVDLGRVRARRRSRELIVPAGNANEAAAVQSVRVDRRRRISPALLRHLLGDNVDRAGASPRRRRAPRTKSPTSPTCAARRRPNARWRSRRRAATT